MALAVSALLLVACGDKTGPDTTDTSPPVLSWNLLNKETRETREIKGNGVVTVAADDHFVIFFKARDPGGVKNLTLGGGESWTCNAGDVAQNGQGSFAGQNVTLQPNSRGEVEQYAFTLMGYAASWECPGGFRFDGGSAVFQGGATNYSGRRVTASLELVRPR